MKISAVNNKISYRASSIQTNKKTERAVCTREFIKRNKIYLEAGAASLLIGGILWVHNGGRGNYASMVNNLLGVKNISFSKKHFKNFPKDIQYRKDLINGAGGIEKDYKVLRPVVGGEEYKAIVEAFSDSPQHYSPGLSLVTDVKDGFDMSGKISQKYRANLHIHTTHSDGRMNVAELLDQSAKYADEIAANFKNNPDAKAKYAPFTIAITDHDTLEGCKEAINIIRNNPLQYKNLRIVLGCELTVEDKLLERSLKKPVSIHLLLHGINPFDEKLNAYLDMKKANRIQSVKDIITQSKEKLVQLYPDTAAKLSYDEAKNLYTPIDKGILHVDGHTRDYIYYRTMFTELFEKNPEVKTMLEAKGLNPAGITYLSPRKKYFDEINYGEKGKEWKQYKKIIDRYTADLLGISEKEAASKMKLTPEMENVFADISLIAENARPKLDSLQPAYVDMEEFINLFKEQKYGYMGIAHPGLTNVGQALTYSEESIQSMLSLFTMFKKYGGDRAFCAELYYHYFGEVGKSKSWLNNIDNYARAAGLTPSGGLDSHGKSVFYSDI